MKHTVTRPKRVSVPSVCSTSTGPRNSSSMSSRKVPKRRNPSRTAIRVEIIKSKDPYLHYDPGEIDKYPEILQLQLYKLQNNLEKLISTICKSSEEMISNSKELNINIL